MEDQLRRATARHQELERLMQDPAILADRERFRRLSTEYAELETVLRLHRDLIALEGRLTEARDVSRTAPDPELKQLANHELEELAPKAASAREKLMEILDPPNPHDRNDVVIEIRSGAGGDEASLFAAELFRLYSRFAERQGWTVQLVSTSRTTLGGYKEVIAEIHGRNVFRSMKFESGVHRVQRIPATEKSGRVHTSTASVVVLPEVEETELTIDPKDIEITATTSSGHGGQSVNTTYSAIRVIHRPTGITVNCQDERSQKQNREKALRILRARLVAHQEGERRREASAARRSIIGSGDRSEKIRTYNFPQDRMTDHRLKESFHGLSHILDGQIDRLVEALQRADAALRNAAT